MEIEQNIIHNSIIITVSGWSIPKLHWYEEGNADIGEIVISGSDSFKPIGYRMEIPIKEFYDCYYSRNFEKILKIVDASLPPVFRENEYLIYDKLIEKLHK